jgi:enterochelin esterase-like enzyme
MTSRPRRTSVWLDGLGEWSWPGQGGAAAAEVQLPPPWVPAFPPRLERATAPPTVAGGRARRALIAALLTSLVIVCGALALQGRLGVEHLLGVSTAPPPERFLSLQSRLASEAPPLPALRNLSSDSAGSSIDTATYSSTVLHHEGSFYVYLPPGYATTSHHYPVLYLLDGNSQSATAFLEIGLQEEMDQLIARHVIPPMIAVMIQGGPGANNWRNIDGLHYESYILEAQDLIDRMLPTIPDRNARAIAGDSMGGYGAMNATLSSPYRFGVVESWIGFFNGLEGKLHSDRAIFSRLGLRAFLYGGEADHIADPAEDPSFAADLRANGVRAKGVIYPGGHTMETLQAHLGSMLAFAGHALREGEERIAGQAAAASKAKASKAKASRGDVSHGAKGKTPAG